MNDRTDYEPQGIRRGENTFARRLDPPSGHDENRKSEKKEIRYRVDYTRDLIKHEHRVPFTIRSVNTLPTYKTPTGM